MRSGGERRVWGPKNEAEAGRAGLGSRNSRLLWRLRRAEERWWDEVLKDGDEEILKANSIRCGRQLSKVSL